MDGQPWGSLYLEGLPAPDDYAKYQSKHNNTNRILWCRRSVSHFTTVLNVNDGPLDWVMSDHYKHPESNTICWLWTHCQTKQYLTVMISLQHLQGLLLHKVNERWCQMHGGSRNMFFGLCTCVVIRVNSWIFCRFIELFQDGKVAHGVNYTQ